MDGGAGKEKEKVKAKRNAVPLPASVVPPPAIQPSSLVSIGKRNEQCCGKEQQRWLMFGRLFASLSFLGPSSVSSLLSDSDSRQTAVLREWKRVRTYRTAAAT